MGLFLVLDLFLTCAHKSLAEPWAALVSLLLRIETIMSLIFQAILLAASILPRRRSRFLLFNFDHDVIDGLQSCFMKLIMLPLATDGPSTFSWKTRPAFGLWRDDRNPKGFGHRMASLVYGVALPTAAHRVCQLTIYNPCLREIRTVVDQW